MKELQISYLKALDIVIDKRPIACPNIFFAQQLKLYNKQLLREVKIRRKLIKLEEESKAKPATPNLGHRHSPSRIYTFMGKKMVNYSCLKCSHHLFDEKDIITHIPHTKKPKTASLFVCIYIYIY